MGSQRKDLIEQMRQTLGIITQREALAGGDLSELSKLANQLADLSDDLCAVQVSLQAKNEQFDALQGEYAELMDAIFDADESHEWIAEMAEKIRKQEWADLEADGVISESNLMLKILDVVAIPISEQQAAEFAAWIMGYRGAVESGRARALAKAIREFMEKVDQS